MESSIDTRIIVWTRLQVPIEEIDTDQWIGYFQPMAKEPDHCGSSWAKIEGHPDTALLVTHWRSSSAMKDFRESPSAQLLWENLAANGIRSIASYETIYVGYGSWFNTMQKSYLELFWVYFKTPMTEDQKARLSKIHGINTPGLGIGGPKGDLRKYMRQYQHPVMVWTNKTEIMHGVETQLMLWPHFWVSPEKAEWRHHLETVPLSPVTANYLPKPEALRFRMVEQLGAIEFREDLCQFNLSSRV